jgi:hypothetical protein
MIEHQKLLSVLGYDKETGHFTWLTGHKAGTRAGHVSKISGYEMIGIGDKGQYYAHRLAWFHVTGDWPKTIDHKNGVRSDNAWCNLREATIAQNSHNSRIPRRNTSGAKGVTWDKWHGKWVMKMVVSGKTVINQTTDDYDLAVIIMAEMREKHHGEFLRHQ